MPPCSWCDAPRPHNPCPEEVRRVAQCAVLGHLLISEWAAGGRGCSYCGTPLPR